MLDIDKPFDIINQINLMKKYVVIENELEMKKLLTYSGYFRLSRYGKYLLSFTNILKTKPQQNLLFDLYKFDIEIRKLFFSYCKKAEIQFKSHLSNAVSIKENDAIFYIKKEFYTDTKGEKDKNKRNLNKKHFETFFENIINQEKNLRQKVRRYPELKEYRNGGQREKIKIPCWAAFSYFDFGTITNMYAYLRGDIRKNVLLYGYSRKKYGKKTVKQVDTWLDAIRNLRNICSHHNRLVGKTSSIVLLDIEDESDLLYSQIDLFSRIYALKKILSKEDGEQLKVDLKQIIQINNNLDIYKFNILPKNWELLFDKIKRL